MKKLLFILSAIFVSVSIRGAELDPNTEWDNLNPYAYDLKSEVINNGRTLHLTYKFNAPGFGNEPKYNLLNPKTGGTGRGIQIYLLYKDADGNFQRVTKDNGDEYRIVTGGYNKAQAWDVYVDVSDIPNNCKGKELTWEARVHGNIGRTTPKVVKASGTKPYNAYGIAVNNDPTHKRFAQMYVSEAYPRQYSKDQYNGWNKHGEGDVYKYANQMLEYTPLLGFQCAHFKHWHDGNVSHFASTWNWTQTIDGHKITCTYSHNYEPNRIKVSEDGRIFTSSFHPKASCAVVEYSRGDRDTYDLGHHFYSTITNDYNDNDDIENSDAIGGVDNPFLYRRCIGMDVKGKGENLKIILLWIDANACSYKNSNGTTVQSAKFEIYEYEIGRAEKNGISYLHPLGLGTSSGYVHKIGEYDWDYKGATGGGAFYQGARYGVRNDKSVPKTQLLYNNMLRGFADLAYGPNNDVWVKIDYCFDEPATAQIIRVKLSDGSTTPYTVAQNTTANYGGSGILIKGDLLITSPTDNTICMYQINANGELTATNNIPTAKYTITDNRIGTWVTGFATDFAGNLFSLTQAATNGENYTANVLGIAMPYKTAITTRAKGTFTVTDPVPNILATDLTYAPYGNENKYEFSFNVNTKPELAQIRFYKSEADMLANNDNYSFYYEFSEAERKQGRMSVIFDAVGGGTIDGYKQLLNDTDGNGRLNLPRGEYYWNVYVKTRESNVFAPIYTQPNTGDDVHHRLHATIDNNPNNKGFGHIYASNYDGINNTLMVYSIGDGDVIDQSANINSSKRHALIQKLTTDLKNTRRPAVAPDGTVFLTDYGNGTTQATNGPSGFEHGGIYVFDPTTNKQASGEAQLTRFFNDNEVTTGVSFYGTGANTILYKTNTYDEFTNHPGSGVGSYQDEKWMRNGYRIFNVGNANGSIKHTVPLGQSTLIPFVGTYDGKNYGGDASGNISMKATADGVWFCQNRVGTVEEEAGLKGLKDNFENVALMFYNKNNKRAFESYKATVNGKSLSQTASSIMQSTPGGGMTVSPDEKYLYVVNHEGNILEFQIGGSVDAKTLTHTRTYQTNYVAISSLNFDYAGNLVATAFSEGYPTPNKSNIVIYTMPYPNKENARAIPASEMYRYIPERVADDSRELGLLLDYRVQDGNPCYVDIYRPMLTGMLNTICLPFDINTKQSDATDYYNATILKFSQAVVTNQNGEKILELQFTAEEDGVLKAGVPYLIQAKNPITGIVQLKQTVTFTKKQGQTVHKEFNDGQPNSIDFKGIMSTQSISVDSKPWPLILVDNNRLAEVQSSGNMRGFRAYFQLANELEPGTQAAISMRKPTPTNVITIDGKRVNIEKFLREGRVYIRVGDTLYTINGEKL